MKTDDYRRVLGLHRVRGVLALMFAARIPVAATNMVLTLHVVLTLHRDYGSAGLVVAAGTIGEALGSPLTGRFVDSRGLRRVVAVTTTVYSAYWLTAPLLPYGGLLASSFVGEIFALPAISIGRQALTALVPERYRASAFSLDSISLELTFMVGPALGVLLATTVSTTAAMTTVGVLIMVSGIALFAMNPPMRPEYELMTEEVRESRRRWLRGPVAAGLVIACGAAFVLSGTEVSAVAALRGVGRVGFTGVVTIAMCLASIVGGAVHGGLRRAPGSVTLLVLFGLLAVPVGWAGGQWWVLCLALVPSNLMCAPTLTATADQVSGAAPAAVRGEAIGLYNSALVVGGAWGSPLIGVIVDHWDSAAGFAAAGIGGALIALIALPLTRRGRRGPARDSGQRSPPTERSSHTRSRSSMPSIRIPSA